MQTDLRKKISDKVATLNSDDQERVLEFVEARISRSNARKKSRPIWEIAKEISESIPLEEWQKLPSDGSVNHDHYLYGAPKRY